MSIAEKARIIRQAKLEALPGLARALVEALPRCECFECKNVAVCTRRYPTSRAYRFCDACLGPDPGGTVDELPYAPALRALLAGLEGL